MLAPVEINHMEAASSNFHEPPGRRMRTLDHRRADDGHHG